MPELPEVETTVRGLRKKVLGRTFIDVWTDFSKNIKRPRPFGKFKKEIKNRKILGVRRRAKNILFDLSEGKILLVHQKMTGHLLFGKWEMKGKRWESKIPGPLLKDPKNCFLHIIFLLDNHHQIALSDLRKFAKIELWNKNDLEKAKDFSSLGPEPLDKSFTFKKFVQILPKKGRIKQILMDQTVISGIGNIYSDEILWRAKIHPARDVSKISKKELKEIYQSIRPVLERGIAALGDSFNDYRLPDGTEGNYQNIQRVYAREGKPCFRKDGGIIQRLKMGGRSAHFCPVCQH